MNTQRQEDKPASFNAVPTWKPIANAGGFNQAERNQRQG
jgi:hypothetical protein